VYEFISASDDGSRVYVDGVPVLDNWFDQAAPPRCAFKDMTSGPHTVVVEYYEAFGVAKMQFSTSYEGGATPSGWDTEYYANPNLQGTPVITRKDGATIDFQWGLGAPNPCLPADGFSVRWTQTLDFQAGVYEFSTTSDDGSRVFVDGVPVLDNWVDQASVAHTAVRDMTSGPHTVVVEYYENGGLAQMQFSRVYRADLSTATHTPTPTPTPTPP
jgi:hypothetical protein